MLIGLSSMGEEEGARERQGGGGENMLGQCTTHREGRQERMEENICAQRTGDGAYMLSLHVVGDDLLLLCDLAMLAGSLADTLLCFPNAQVLRVLVQAWRVLERVHGQGKHGLSLCCLGGQL